MTQLGATQNERPVKGVIVCADDFAVNQSASLGIAKLARMGRISATSVMVLSPRWPGDARLLIDLRGHIDVGLHLDWTSTFAVAQGHGMPLGRAMLRALVGGFDRKQAEVVIERQLDLFETRWQSPPDYVDGHQHVQQFAGIREALVDVLARRYGAQAPYLRISRAPAGTADLKAGVIAIMGASALENIASGAGLKRARALLGTYNLAGNTLNYAALMAGWLAQATEGSIIMCHPAQASEPEDEIGLARALEFAYLAGPDYAYALNQAGVMPMRGVACDALVGPTKISR
ncbi:MAG: ChbG/HpnK family deacetylase [Comamonadaceae bacterium]|nr:ChbG/HpnK family deacetylase [Comamonadaceae bacterium]